MSAWSTFRLAAWRELWGRWPVHLGMIGIGAVGLFDEWFTSTVLALALFALVGMVAAGGRVAADPFWRGLGGPGWARVLGRVAVQAPPIGVALLGLDFGPWGLVYVLVYASVVAARARGGGWRLFVAPLVVVLGVGAALILLSALFRTGTRDIAPVWCFGASAVLVGCAARWEHTLEGARRGAGSLGWRFPFAGFLGLLVATAASSLWPPARYPVWNQEVSPSGALLLAPIGRRYTLGHTEVWEAGARRPVGPPGAWEGSIGPNGTVVLHHNLRHPGAVLETVEGETAACTEDVGFVQTYSWRPDGRAVAMDVGESIVRFSLEDGCTRIVTPGAAWLGDRLLWADGDTIRGDQFLVVAPGRVLDLAQSPGHVYALAGGLLHEVTETALEMIAPTEADGLQGMAHGVCTWGRRPRCWDGATLLDVALPTWAIDVDLMVNGFGGDRRLWLASSGRTIATLPWFEGRAGVLADGTVRILDERSVVDVSPDGDVTELRF